jgi:hypothetical protein
MPNSGTRTFTLTGTGTVTAVKLVHLRKTETVGANFCVLSPVKSLPASHKKDIELSGQLGISLPHQPVERRGQMCIGFSLALLSHYGTRDKTDLPPPPLPLLHAISPQ